MFHSALYYAIDPCVDEETAAVFIFTNYNDQDTHSRTRVYADQHTYQWMANHIWEAVYNNQLKLVPSLHSADIVHIHNQSFGRR